jgi:hypothetical protein
MDFIKCKDGTTFARVIQSFATVYSPKAWLNKQTWMNSTEIQQFFLDLQCLESLTERFVEEDLLESLKCRVPAGASLVEFGRSVAADAFESTMQMGRGPYTLCAQPSDCRSAAVQQYIAAQQAAGQKEVRGRLHKHHPDNPRDKVEDVVDFRIEPWWEIIKRSQRLFYGASGAWFVLGALEHNGRRWSWQPINHDLLEPF